MVISKNYLLKNLLFIVFNLAILSFSFSQDWSKMGQTINSLGHLGFDISSSEDGLTVVSGGWSGVGVVKVHRWDGNQWIQMGQDIFGEHSGFGWSVDISADGNVIIAGEIGHSINIVGIGEITAGMAKVYAWNGVDWVQKGENLLKKEESESTVWENSSFGASVQISSDGNIVAIGAPGYSNSTFGGLLRILEWDGQNWVKRGDDIKNKNDGSEALGGVGANIALNSIGTILATSKQAIPPSSVQAFEWDGAAWNKLGDAIKGEIPADGFGNSLDMNSDGQTLAIGTNQQLSPFADEGYVKIFDWSGSAWSQRGVNLMGEELGDYFGTSVSLNAGGNVVAVGATYGLFSSDFEGYVKTYFWNQNNWEQLGSKVIGEELSSHFGTSVSLNSSGNKLAIGAPFGNITGGTILMYEYDGFVATKNSPNSISGISIYPNPFEGNTNLLKLEESKNISVDIFDAYGHIIFTKTYRNIREAILEYPPLSGIYYVRIKAMDTGNSTSIMVRRL